MARPFAKSVVAAMVLAWPVIPAHAEAKLQIQPIRADIDLGRPGSLTLINHAETETHLEATAYLWDQDAAGRDVLTPTNDLIITPPLMKIEPGGRQMLRFAAVSAQEGAPDQEQTYRIILEEVPLIGEAQTGVSLLLRYSIPVFVSGELPEAGNVQIRLVDDGGVCRVDIENNRAQHVNLERLNVFSGQKAQEVKVPLYLLANSRIELACPAKVNGEQVYDRVVLESDQGEFSGTRTDSAGSVSGCSGRCEEN